MSLILILSSCSTHSKKNTHHEGAEISLSAKAIFFTLRLIDFRSMTNAMFHDPSRATRLSIPASIVRMYDVKEHMIRDRSVVTISPKKRLATTHIIFLHGGAYVLEMSDQHWDLVTRVLNKSLCKVSVIDYPLAPESTYLETFAMLQESYMMLQNDHPHDRFIFLGDSAGAGLALAFNQHLIQTHSARLPIKNILISPWIDLTLSDREIETMQAHDVILSTSGLNYCASIYAGKADKDDPLLSPINGSLDKLPNTAIFYGTHELFYPDFMRLKHNAQESNASIRFYEYTRMQHDWVLFPIPETDHAIDRMIEFIEK